MCGKGSKREIGVDVGNYFKRIQGTVTDIKTKLEKIVLYMKSEGNLNAVGVETAIKTLIDNTRSKI
ncbi:variable large family protein [Borrelia hermsii]|uniref:Variable large protein n=1 Tax=Borrelia hermsii TaxID=140 RepID=A0AAN1CFM0_BORHE|nr:hypothetical protein A0V01_05815 [Borrelia hermsii]UPA08676.1 variable large family protein [Borrelia hermsii DAH]